MNYFTLFGLPVHYLQDDNLLTSRFQELQRQYHPDKFANQPERERLLALQHAATINEAYQTLKHPLKRAEYLLSLQGFNLSNEQHTMHDLPFLTEQLALREELAQIELLPEAQEAQNVLASFDARLKQSIEQRKATMVAALDKQCWQQAADEVRKLRFLDKLQQQVEQLEEKLLGFE